MGRHRKPIEQHKREGTYQPCRHSGPRPVIVSPVKPDDLSGGAGDVWDSLSPHVATLGIYTAADAMALRLLCESFALYIKNCDQLKSDGNQIGNKEHPAVRSRSRHFREALELMRQFGMTPASRNKILGILTPNKGN